MATLCAFTSSVSRRVQTSLVSYRLQKRRFTQFGWSTRQACLGTLRQLRQQSELCAFTDLLKRKFGSRCVKGKCRCFLVELFAVYIAYHCSRRCFYGGRLISVCSNLESRFVAPEITFSFENLVLSALILEGSFLVRIAQGYRRY